MKGPYYAHVRDLTTRNPYCTRNDPDLVTVLFNILLSSRDTKLIICKLLFFFLVHQGILSKYPAMRVWPRRRWGGGRTGSRTWVTELNSKGIPI